jgi:hypothetical protein
MTSFALLFREVRKRERPDERWLAFRGVELTPYYARWLRGVQKNILALCHSSLILQVMKFRGKEFGRTRPRSGQTSDEFQFFSRLPVLPLLGCVKASGPVIYVVDGKQYVEGSEAV